MFKKSLLAGLLAFTFLFGGVLTASAGDKPWIHIEITDAGDKDNMVKINLPLSLVEVALEVAEDELAAEGQIELDNCDVSIADMRRMWKELRDAGDADFVTVVEDDERVHIYRKGDNVYVEVDDTSNREEKVRMSIPVHVVDTLFEGDGEQLNLTGALAELREANKGELLSIQDGDEHIRIWID